MNWFEVKSHMDRIPGFIKSCTEEYYGEEEKPVYDKVLVLQNDIVVHCVATKEGILQWTMYDDKLNLGLGGCASMEEMIEKAQGMYKQWYWLYFQYQVVRKQDLKFPGKAPVKFNADLAKLHQECLPDRVIDSYWWDDIDE